MPHLKRGRMLCMQHKHSRQSGRPHIGDAEEQVRHAVARCDHSVSAEIELSDRDGGLEGRAVRRLLSGAASQMNQTHAM